MLEARARNFVRQWIHIVAGGETGIFLPKGSGNNEQLRGKAGGEVAEEADRIMNK